MKKHLFRMAAAALVVCCAANVQAAGDEKNGNAYFTKAELARARAEFAEKTGNETRISEVPHAQQQNSSARVYRIDGTPVNDASHGILIQDNKKFIR